MTRDAGCELSIFIFLSGQSQVILRSVPGHYQVSLRSPLVLSELTSSVRQSLKLLKNEQL